MDMYTALIYIFTFIGVFTVVQPVYKILRALFIHFGKGIDLQKKYGEGSWALVTGATDGIGFGFC